MSEPPSRSPDSLTGASTEISALQLVERRGDGRRERGRDGWGERVGGREGKSEGGWKSDVGERNEMETEGKVKKKEMQRAGRRADIVILEQCSSPYSFLVIHFHFILPSPAHTPLLFLLCQHPPSSYFSHLAPSHTQINAFLLILMPPTPNPSSGGQQLETDINT